MFSFAHFGSFKVKPLSLCVLTQLTQKLNNLLENFVSTCDSSFQAAGVIFHFIFSSKYDTSTLARLNSLAASLLISP